MSLGRTQHGQGRVTSAAIMQGWEGGGTTAAWLLLLLLINGGDSKHKSALTEPFRLKGRSDTNVGQ